MKRFDRTLRQLQREKPTEGLTAAQTAFRPTPVPHRWPWLATSGIAAAVVAGTLLMMAPARSEAALLGQVGTALDAAPIRHTTVYGVEGPRHNQVISQIWESGKHTRLDMSQDSVMGTWAIFDGRFRWTFVPTAKRVYLYSDPGYAFTSDSLPNLAAAIRKRDPGQKLELREVVRDGRPMLALTLEGWFTTSSPKGGTHRYATRTLWVAHRDDKLPREMLHYRTVHTDGGKGTRLALTSRGTIEYPNRLPDKIFDTTTPPGWQLVDRRSTNLKPKRR